MSDVNIDRLVSTFCELVKIPSESPNDEEFIAHVASLFKMMGGRAKKDTYGNLIVKFEAKNSKSTTPLAFCAHADTVKPGIGIEPMIENGRIRSNGKTILAADDKAAISEIMEMIRLTEKRPPLEIVITRCEEPGSWGSTNLDYSMIDSKIAYVLDTEQPNEILVGGPTVITFDVDYKGKASHAGMAPEKGISAILAASKAISRLKLGKLDDETTANVGVFQGGEIRNGVPANAKVLAECRCLKHEKAVVLADEMEKIFRQASDEVGTEIVIERKIALKAYFLDEKSKPVQLVINAMKKNGITPETKIIRGGTDATAFNSNGIQTAVLGVGFRDIHSCGEYVIIDEMVTMTKIIRTMVEDNA
ncbi:MAG: M20/M25/M40 family metallo-hydrolase [bacterium]